MTATNRVDELRKRYHENPKKFFAPFANELRKTGQIDRALLILQKHLGEQPASMNGFVVYGQCLFETGRLEEARQPFELALGLDPENLIALRHLGDIARLGGDKEAARGWYARVLELDRRNDEVLALMQEVGGAERVETAPSQAPSIVAVAPTVSVSGGDEGQGIVDREVAAPRPRATTPPATPTLRPLRPRTPVDPSARTVEVTARPKSEPPAKRASLLDVSFDFGEMVSEGSSAPPPAAPPPPPRRASTPIATIIPPAPEERRPAQTPRVPLEEIKTLELTRDDLAQAMEPTADRASHLVEPPALPPAPAAGATPTFSTLVEQSPEGESLASLPHIEGLEQAEFSAEVSPLSGLESSEFEGGDAAPLDGLETAEYSAAGTEPLDGLEPSEFVAPADAHAGGALGLDPIEDDGFTAVPLDVLSSAPEPEEERISSPVDGIPLLADFGDDTAEIPEPDTDSVRLRMETPATFVTETMAQVYVQQGLTSKAIEVYRQLVEQSPEDEGLRARLRALEEPEPASTPVAAPLIDADGLMDLGMGEPEESGARASFGFDTPTSVDAVAEPPAPANAMLSEMSFDGLSLSTPAAGTRTTPPSTPARSVTPQSVPSGPTAREFFASFARRALTPATGTPAVPMIAPSSAVPSAAGGPLSPLDTLFGVSVDEADERAAHRLAAIGATSGPSGGSALDSLFGEGPSAPMPEELRATARQSVPRASEKLRFDQFFASSVPSATPSASITPQPALPAIPLSDPASAPEPEPPSVVAPDSDDDEDDLDQFQGWLRGLTT